MRIVSFKVLAKQIEALGGVRQRQKGSHVVFKLNKDSITVPNHREISPVLYCRIQKQITKALKSA